MIADSAEAIGARRRPRGRAGGGRTRDIESDYTAPDDRPRITPFQGVRGKHGDPTEAERPRSRALCH
ncbi:hypothetical protein AB0C34_11015 [Nocardia sp. NPDC049220]|uniref:hypothetical protein n=1 Tax=Nocardia sp. NPDC049220 TaxID=3155273 RepID=UPI0033DBD578